MNHDFVRRGFEGVGATIMGRDIFGPVHGAWPVEQCPGWWVRSHYFITKYPFSPTSHVNRSKYEAAPSSAS